MRRPRIKRPNSYALRGSQTAAVAERVLGLMTQAGLSQNALAKKAGVAQGLISDLLRGKKNFQQWHIVQIASALGVAERDLVPDVAGPAPEPERPMPPQPNPEKSEPDRKASDPDATLPAGLRELLDEERDFITPWERDQLVASAFNRPRHIKPDKEFFRRTLEFWRSELQRNRGGGSGGTPR